VISILRGATIDPVFNSHPRSSNYAFREQGSALVLMADEETWVSLLQAIYVEFFDLRDCRSFRVHDSPRNDRRI